MGGAASPASFGVVLLFLSGGGFFPLVVIHSPACTFQGSDPVNWNFVLRGSLPNVGSGWPREFPDFSFTDKLRPLVSIRLGGSYKHLQYVTKARTSPTCFTSTPAGSFSSCTNCMANSKASKASECDCASAARLLSNHHVAVGDDQEKTLPVNFYPYRLSMPHHGKRPFAYRSNPLAQFARSGGHLLWQLGSTSLLLDVWPFFFCSL